MIICVVSPMPDSLAVANLNLFSPCQQEGDLDISVRLREWRANALSSLAKSPLLPWAAQKTCTAMQAASGRQANHQSSMRRRSIRSPQPPTAGLQQLQQAAGPCTTFRITRGRVGAGCQISLQGLLGIFHP